MCQRVVSAPDLLCKEILFFTENVLNVFLDNEKAEKILVKTIFRRSKAFMELGYQLRALNDISFCLRSQVNATGNANNVLFNYWEVRMICTCSNNNYCLLLRFLIGIIEELSANVSSEGLTRETTALESLLRWPNYLINSVD